MDEAARHREARRQKVLARSHGGRMPIMDLATKQNEIAPQGATAELVDPADLDAAVSPCDPSPSADDSGKSASRLAAERRRRRILEKKTERMAKVHGDRAVRQGDNGGGGGGQQARAGEETLDDMLETAEAEFFGQQTRAGVAEAKPVVAPPQAFFKSSPSAAGAGVPPTEATPSQSKTAKDRSGGEAESRKPPNVAASRAAAPTRRPAGNKALDRQPFDLAAVQSLAGTSKRQGTVSTKGAEKKRFLGGVKFWASLESATRVFVLLLLGAGVGGLLLPQGRAAVAQAKFEAEYLRANAGMNSRSRLEAFLSDSDPHRIAVKYERPNKVERVVGADLFNEEFVEVSSPPSSSERDSKTARESTDKIGSSRGHREGSVESFGEECAMDAVCGGVGTIDDGWRGADLDIGDLLDDVADATATTTPLAVTEGAVSAAARWFLSHVDRLVGWAHYFSTSVMPIGWVNQTSCVPAFVLAVLVRLIVATMFAAARGALGLPAFPPATGSSKPGMILGVVLASVPSLGKLFAFGVFLKDLFADTTLVVAGTVLTLAICLGREQEPGLVGYAGSLVGGVGRFVFGVDGDIDSDGSLKEL